MARGLYEIDKGQYSTFEEVAYANGTCVLLPRTTLRIVGLLDPVYFAYGEDVDWSWRARMLGIKSYYVPSAIIYHKLSSSFGRLSKRKFYLIERNRLLTELKNYSRNTLIVLLPMILTVEVSILVYAFINGMLREKIKVYSDLLRLRHYIIQQRSLLQSHRKVPDREIIKIFDDEINHPFLATSATHVLNRFLKLLAKIIQPCIT
jgi:GT2 family glycosyltransferase